MTKCNSFSFYNDCLSPQIHSETVSIDLILHVDTLLYWYRAVRPYDNSIAWVKFLRHFLIALVEICIWFPTIKKKLEKKPEMHDLYVYIVLQIINETDTLTILVVNMKNSL